MIFAAFPARPRLRPHAGPAPARPRRAARAGPRRGGTPRLSRVRHPLLRVRSEKIAIAGGEWRFEEPPADAQAVLTWAHEALVSRETVAEVPLTGLSFL